ncbi:hypothetical protein HYC85_021003 [Camellia sinensis]|uniref:Uncharacterized protein n=1 Tax=Camellia sinensis TaxID=4442 RepID=A0A7J7GK78_CAMSI|nr:hypothetical protein HYC85_021003 [Camellia sinensis]
MAATAWSTFPSISSLSSSSSSTTIVAARSSIRSFPCSDFFKLKPYRLRISQKIGTVPKNVFGVPIVSCLDDNYCEASSEFGSSHVTNDSKAITVYPTSFIYEAALDIAKLRQWICAADPH